MKEHPRYEEFRRIWTELPKRAGSDPELAGFQAFLTHAGNEDLDAVREGAIRYAEFCDAMMLTGTDKVMQGSRFLGRNQEWNQEWHIPATNGKHP